MTVYFTSDLHFGHANIIKYCNRPYSSVEEMNIALIDNWNALVNPDDTVYLLGDVSFLPAAQTDGILNRLLGKIHLVKGNHDKPSKLNLGRFASVSDILDTKVTGRLDNWHVSGGMLSKHIVMCHYAFKVWNGSHHGNWHLYGHSHGTLPDDPTSLSIDVGVDSHGYKPLSFSELHAIMGRKNKFKPVDHHGRPGYTGE